MKEIEYCVISVVPFCCHNYYYYLSVVYITFFIFLSVLFISFVHLLFHVYLRYTILTSELAYTKLFAKISITMFATSKIAVVRIPSNGWLLPAVTRMSESTKNGWSMT